MGERGGGRGGEEAGGDGRGFSCEKRFVGRGGGVVGHVGVIGEGWGEGMIGGEKSGKGEGGGEGKEMS